jgi:Spy/CpxP family protein refolding chaperone
MNAFDRKFRQFIDRLTHWWSNSGKPAGQKGIEGAAAKARDLRETETAKKAAAKLSDLRETDTAKKAEAKLSDLRGTDTAKKAEAKLADLRQREPVKKAEETARKALHDLFSGSKSDTSSEG